MPELPEVETVRQGLLPAMKGKTLVKLELNRKNLRFDFDENLAQKLHDKQITDIERRSKYLLTLSALDGVGPEQLNISKLIERAAKEDVTEILLALNATIDGQTTAHYLTDALNPCNVEVTMLAHGVPVGGELDYLDEGTLSAAVKARKPF